MLMKGLNRLARKMHNTILRHRVLFQPSETPFENLEIETVNLISL
jgi:hypothetical protein